MENTDLLQTNFIINELISWRDIDGQILILDTSINESAHELNQIGSYIFTEISRETPLLKIKEALINTYQGQLDQQEIETDFFQYLNDLIVMKIITPKKL